MKILNRWMWMVGVAAVLALGGNKALAQGRGNFDPEQMRQRMLERFKERLEVKSDDEWKIISERIEKVMTAQRETRMAGFGGFGGGRRGGGGGDNAGGDTNNNGGRRNRGGGGESSPEVEALQKAIDDKASNDDIKTKLAKVRDSQKDKEAKLVKAQDELRKVLSVRQEATAVLMGLLK